MFDKFKRKKQVAVSQDIQHPSEILDLFVRLNLFHQVALLRLMSRNLVINMNGKSVLGHEMNFEVNGAMIEATSDDDLTETGDT